MNVAVPRVGRMMDVAAYHAVALAGTGTFPQLLLEVGNIGNGCLYLLLDGLLKRIVRLAVTCAVVVVDLV